MEAKLLDSLHHRLGELEHQIQARRRDLVADFQHYYRDLLHGVAPDTASNVYRALAASLSDYPTLRPELQAAESQLPETPRPAAFQPSPSSAVSGGAEAPGSPRERENELRGLFTPTYLPLLDSSPILPRPILAGPLGSVSGIPQSTLLPEMGSQGIGQGQVVGMEGTEEQGGGQGNDQWLPPAPPFSVSTWPNNSARSIDDARSSVSSDKSDSKPARSALRRSSSISKPPQSPRRVRFEFMGAEVLPTASPQPSGFMNPRPASPDPDGDDGHAAFDSNLCGDTTEEEHAPPRKVSSSDALRALSRTPLEAGTIWTVVNAETDDVAPDQRDPVADQKDMRPPSVAVSRTMPESSRVSQVESLLGYTDKEQVENSDGDDSSDDGFLAMTKTRSSNKKPLLPPMPQSPIKPAQDSAATSAGQTNKQAPTTDRVEKDKSPAFSDDGVPEGDDDLFHFEAGGLSAPPKPRSGPPPRKEEELEESEPKDDESNAPPADTTEGQMSIYATSPAIPIRHASGLRPSSVRFQPGSLGSYKGRPLMMPIVRDPEVLEQANAVGPSQMRGGGVDDETAMEEGSVPQFPPSIPLSFKERFMMEEMMEQEKSRREEEKEGNP
ncbi:hypothetical protein TOPH_00449 [Tolypocladium ophioglossoides CBS 100239]|uniref:Uncharacterized protein n=1 Tax=Tolypocladium ophioglossoides (strain CBS 100239) TaxID=1163406 RepID=A0A0L0NLR9_TOLOC|nr:hypothetical protein TOPH_00449 [Tolypocladium ophioglossoides CBS 100239]